MEHDSVVIDLTEEVRAAKQYCERYGDPNEPWQDYVDWKGIMYANTPGIPNPTHAIVDGKRFKLCKWGLIDEDSSDNAGAHGI